MNSTSPICTLPPEILGEICCLCTSYNADAPLILSAVNRHFHQVAYSHVRAWCKLRLRLGLRTERSQIRKAGLWFRQSGACPLDLFLNITNPSYPLADGRTMESEQEWFARSYSLLASFLQHHRSRIRSLTLRSDTELKAYQLLDAISASNPVFRSKSLHLHSLSIQITNDIPPVPTGWSPLFESFSLFPRLDSLKLINHILPALSTPNIQHLQRLSIVRPLTAPPLPTRKILRMISSASSLIHLDIDSRISVGPIPDSTASSETPSLKSLSLRVNNLPFLLNLLSSSTLEKLRLTDLDGGRESAGEKLGQVMEGLTMELKAKDGKTRGLDLLKTLEISGVRCTEPTSVHWDWCIRHLPSLEALSLKDFGCISLVNILTESVCNEDDFCCPRLSHVYFSGLGALSPLQKLKMKRPGIRIEWENGECQNSGYEHVGHPETPLPAFSYAARGYGFGSLFDYDRREIGDVKMPQGAVFLNDTDSSW
ncbi:hypothetical protein BT96DRAFT_582525 [Gymnopus androsaceus JB14]|uniref:F-box domain-containing protein n=1 Tax=Gymnopus androsaceus JB14 TaxID=1447944 RepID=A0A6A4IJI5_9AGAR|nr:hypothetical protein BT96DRAFT_582525 [Gymnopus androsaceus JB14]